MRITGWILFVVGIALGIGSLIAFLTGNGFPARIFVYIIILIFTGWRLKTYGTGLVATTGGSDSAVSSDSGFTGPHLLGEPAHAQEIATVELPFIPVVAELIRKEARKSGRVWGWTGGIFAAAFLLLGVFIGYMGSRDNPEMIKAFYILAGVSVLLVAGVVTAWLLQSGLPARRDLREGKYLRTRGPVEVVGMSTGYMLRLADRAFLLSKSPAATSLAGMDWAVVDYTRHLHVILGVWNADAKNLYLAEGYNPENRILVDAS